MVRIVTRWCVLGVLVCLAQASSVGAQSAVRAELPSSPSRADALQAELHGTIHDEDGRPLSGVVVSAVGSTTAFAFSDANGRFVFRSLPPGPYLLRAHLQGYVPGRGRIVQVSAGGRNVWTAALTRVDGERSPQILAAGVAGGVESTETPLAPEPGPTDIAWRLRHLKRSVLREEAIDATPIEENGSFLEASLGGLSRAVSTPARVASALLGDLSVNGQINLLTTTSFNRPQDLFSVTAGAPRGVAYLSLVAPAPDGQWILRGTMTEGDLASWIVAGSYERRASATHQYEAGVSYAMQRYLGGNADALAAMRDGSRNVGAIHAYDAWSIAPRVTLGYGAKYASYDYLAKPGLLSPRASVAVQPFAHDPLKVRATVSHRETAPGAEQFVPPTVGLWLPPERTFSPISRDGLLRPERLDHVEVSTEREWFDVVVGLRAFQQRVDDQEITLFGMNTAEAPASLGHYYVASAGDFSARGWGVSMSRDVVDGTRVSVDYVHVDADWLRRSPDQNALSRVADSVLRGEEHVHDLTASVESAVTATATRVLVVYKLNSAYAGSAASAAPGAAARFDVQVNQALPFLNFMSAQWEMLVAVRNLFREDAQDGSFYDELLVVRPPKRVLGGVTVRF